MAAQFSNPSRMEESEPAIRWLLKTYKEINPGRDSIDHIPLGTLAVILQHNAGEEAGVAGMFEAALTMPLGRLPSRSGEVKLEAETEMWLRGNYYRLLRRMGKFAEAEGQEALIV